MMTETEARKRWPILRRKNGHSKGYVRLLSPSHPNANAEGYVFEHTYVASRVLGRGLRLGELAHHVYGNRSDNRNLVICDNRYHRQLHGRLSASPDWAQFPARPSHRPRCAICGTGITYDSITNLCAGHYWEQIRQKPRVCRVFDCAEPAGSRSGLCLVHVRHRTNKRRYQKGWDFMPVSCSNCGGAHPLWECRKPRREEVMPVERVPATVVATPPPRSKPKKKPAAGAKIIEGLKQAVTHAKGENDDVRITAYPPPPWYAAPGQCLSCDHRRLVEAARVKRHREKKAKERAT